MEKMYENYLEQQYKPSWLGKLLFPDNWITIPKINSESMKEEYFPKLDDSRIAILSFIKRKSRVLSVGCGFGREINLIHNELKCKVTGVDIDEKCILECKERFNNLKFIVGDITQESYPDNYDYITCIGVTINCFRNLEARKDFIKNAYKSLKNGGELIISVPHAFTNKSCFFRFALTPCFGWLLNWQKGRYFLPSQINKWFEGTDFKIEKVKINNRIIVIARK